MSLSETEEFVRSVCGFDPDRIRQLSPLSPGVALITTMDFSGTVNDTVDLCRHALSKMSHGGIRLLWILSQGNWPLQENKHAFHRLRLSYGERAPNFVRPGHFFEEYESADLLTFFEMSVRYGWEVAVMHHVTSPMILTNRNREAHIYEVRP